MFLISRDLTFTYLSVKEARLKEIKSEILNSEKLKVRIRLLEKRCSLPYCQGWLICYLFVVYWYNENATQMLLLRPLRPINHLFSLHACSRDWVSCTATYYTDDIRF